MFSASKYDVLFDIAVVASYCGVGLRDGRIPDGAITASSIHDSYHASAQARLDYTGNSGSWSAGTSEYNAAST